MKRQSVVTMIGGVILVAWIPFWNVLSIVSTVDFMITAGGRPSIGTLFLPRGLADGLTLLGLGVMVYAFILLARRSHPGYASPVASETPASPDTESAKPVPAPHPSRGDRLRRERASAAFNLLSVPERFVLRWISTHRRIGRSVIIRLGREGGFGEDIGGPVDQMSQHCELVKTESNGDLTIAPAFLDDVPEVLAAWFRDLASSSETL